MTGDGHQQRVAFIGRGEIQTDQRAALLSRASATLAKLTGGAFGQLHADDEDASLSVSRAGDDQPLGMEALSAGTRDQVMLALRLAVTQRQLTQKRLPFVLDDVLVHFDDARATSALSAPSVSGVLVPVQRSSSTRQLRPMMPCAS